MPHVTVSQKWARFHFRPLLYTLQGMPAINTTPGQGSHLHLRHRQDGWEMGVGGEGREAQEKTDTAHKYHLDAFSPFTQSFPIC